MITFIKWLVPQLSDENSTESTLLRQRLRFFGLLFILAAIVGLTPIFADWQLPLANAIVIIVVGVVLIIIDTVDTWVVLKKTPPETIAAVELAATVQEWTPSSETLAGVVDLPEAVG